ncbi:hypothetical protein MMC17_009715 [Xylographa soralifera]|nr:hypothetical protein [Xylographa soralifera]
MDPLSLTLNVAAIAGIVVQAARCIATLKAIQELPAEYRLLLKEIAHIHDVLSDCCTLDIQDPKHGSTSTSMLFVHVQRAGDKLGQLERALQADIPGQSRKEELKALWSGIVRGKQSLSRYRDELKDIRLALTTAMGAFTSEQLSQFASSFVAGANERGFRRSAVARIERSVEDVAHSQGRVLRLLSLLTGGIEIEQSSLPTYADAVSESPIHHIVGPEMTRKLPHQSIRQGDIRKHSTLYPDKLRDLQPSQNACAAWCSCKCHKGQSWKTAQLISNVFGNLCLTYYGLPMLAEPCNQHACRRRQSPSISVTYRFPQALVQRVLSMSMSFADLRGPELMVKLPRVVDWTSPVWRPAIDGNEAVIKDLFARGEASPWDMNPIGGSVLHYATDHFNAGVCRLLLEAGADPLLEDDCKRTPVVMAWEHALSGNLSQEDTAAVVELFKDTDYLSTRQFSVLHKIILGLLSKDLRTELEGSTSEINTLDSQGRSPLSWAAARGDSQKVKILLEYGANSNLADRQNNSPLHYSKTATCSELLLRHGADVLSRNCWGATALHTVCRGNGDLSLLAFLLTSGADPNLRDHDGQTPLHDAALKSNTACINSLIAHGADVNVINISGDSPLRFALMFNAHDSLCSMIESPTSQADFGGINSYGHSFAHSIARTADIETVKILIERQVNGLVLDTASKDADGRTSAEYLEDRLLLLSRSESTVLEGEVLQEAFAQLVQKLNRCREDDKQTEAVELDIAEKLSVRVREIELNIDEGNEGELESDVYFDAVEV